jgi:hypothetical protein
VNGFEVLRLSWPSKSFIESDTTASAAEAREEMFPDGGIYANIPSIGNFLISLSPEEVAQLSKLKDAETSFEFKSRINRIQNPSASLPAYRCEQVLTRMLLSLSRTESGFRGLPIDVFFNEDESSDNPESPFIFTGWPNIRLLQLMAQDRKQNDSLSASKLQSPYVPDRCDDFNIPPENAGSRNYHDERAALQVRAVHAHGYRLARLLTFSSTRPIQDVPMTSRSDLFATTFRLFSTWNACACSCGPIIVLRCSR